jgi:hypothetical protein
MNVARISSDRSHARGERHVIRELRVVVAPIADSRQRLAVHSTSRQLVRRCALSPATQPVRVSFGLASCAAGPPRRGWRGCLVRFD